MKKSLCVGLLCLALSACQSGSKSQDMGAADTGGGKSQPAEDRKQEPGVISLDAAEESAAHISVERIEPKQVAQDFTVPGQLTVNEDRTWRVGAIVSGKIDDLLVKVGDYVRTGQTLARIHSHDVHEARAAYREATVELDRSQSATALAVQRRDRAKRLLDLKAGSRQDLESAENEVTNTQAQIAKAQAEVQKEKIHLTDILHVSVADTNTDQGTHPVAPADDTSDTVPVLAPAAGVIFQRKPSVGSVVNSGDLLFSLTDTSSVWMIAAANETDLSILRPGQTAQIRVRAYPEEIFHGRILKLGEELNPATRTLEVRILVPNPKAVLKPEMYASATVTQPGHRRALLLPEAAVQDIGGLPSVFVRRADKRFEARTVKTARKVNGETEITEGIQAGDSVVVNGSFALKSQMLKSTLQEN